MGLQASPSPLQIYTTTHDPVVVYAYGDLVYYGASVGVSQASHDGVLTFGQSITLTTPTWFVTSPDVGGGIPGTARLEVIYRERDEFREPVLFDSDVSVFGDLHVAGGLTSAADINAIPPAAWTPFSLSTGGARLLNSWVANGAGYYEYNHRIYLRGSLTHSGASGLTAALFSSPPDQQVKAMASDGTNVVHFTIGTDGSLTPAASGTAIPLDGVSFRVGS